MINAAALQLIKEFEGLRLTAYQCPAGKWTIGYGHTGPEVHAGIKITEAEASAHLIKDVESAANYVRRVIGVTLNPNQFGALVSLAFNVGVFGQGLRLALNSKNVDKAIKIWMTYTLVKGVPSDGLTRRRAKEVALFQSPVRP